MTLKEIKPGDPNYYKPLDELIEDLGHAEPASRYGDVRIIVEDLTDALHYLKEYRKTVTNCNQLRTGTWIPVDSGTVNGRCSVCGYESHLYENDVYGEHYCPNCGAWLRLT